jgi:hypothetical protein
MRIQKSKAGDIQEIQLLSDRPAIYTEGEAITIGGHPPPAGLADQIPCAGARSKGPMQASMDSSWHITKRAPDGWKRT